MAKPLQAVSVVAPGFFGLNTQDSGVQLAEGFALEANNCIIDRYGRLGSRKGWSYRTTALGGVNDDNIGVDLEGIHTFLDLGGVKTTLSWNEDTFYTGLDDLIERTPTTGDTITTGNWQAATLNDRAYFVQSGLDPLYFTNESTPNEFKSVPNHTGYTGTVPKGNTVLSAYGRLWIADLANNKTTVFFSDLLDGTKWSGGSAGSLNIAGTFAKDSDTITGLAAHNGNLIIFCTNSIIIYSDSDGFATSVDVTTLTLVETIHGIGCISRDSIQSTGEDVLFLSSTGLRSLGRTIQEKSQPFRDLSKNIRTDLSEHVDNQATASSIKATYFPKQAFYLLTFPTTGHAYCFDTKQSLQDGSLRVTSWDGVTHAGLHYDQVDEDLLFASPNGISRYFGFLDDDQPYRMSYSTNYFDMGDSNTTKIVKKIGCTLIAPSGQSFVMKLGFDYSTVLTSYPFTLETGVNYHYGIDEYNIAEYSGGIKIESIKSPAGGSGSVIQAGFATDINGAPLSIQRMDVFVKGGRLI